MVILKKKPAPLKSECLSEHLQERVRGMFARELGAAGQLTEEVPQHPANARKINTAREVRLRVRLSATWTKNRATDFTRVPGVWFFARQRTSKIYFQWENNRQITPRSQKQDCLVSYVVSAHTILPLNPLMPLFHWLTEHYKCSCKEQWEEQQVKGCFAKQGVDGASSACF